MPISIEELLAGNPGWGDNSNLGDATPYQPINPILQAQQQEDELERRQREIREYLSKTPQQRAQEKLDNALNFKEKIDKKTGQKRKSTTGEKIGTGARWVANILSQLAGPDGNLQSNVLRRELADYGAVAPNLRMEQTALEATKRAQDANQRAENVAAMSADVRKYAAELRAAAEAGKLDQKTAHQAGLLALAGRKQEADELVKAALAEKMSAQTGQITQQTEDLKNRGGLTGDVANAQIINNLPPAVREAITKTVGDLAKAKGSGAAVKPRLIQSPTEDVLQPDGSIRKVKSYQWVNPPGTGGASSGGSVGSGAVEGSGGKVEKTPTSMETSTPRGIASKDQPIVQEVLASRRYNPSTDQKNALNYARGSRASVKKALDGVNNLMKSEEGRKFFGPGGNALYRLNRMTGGGEKYKQLFTEIQVIKQNATNSKALHLRALGGRGVSFLNALDSSFPPEYESLDGHVGSLLAQELTTSLIEATTAHPKFEEVFQEHDSGVLINYLKDQQRNIMAGKGYKPPTIAEMTEMLVTQKVPKSLQSKGSETPRKENPTALPKIGETFEGGKVKKITRID
jgi:hypothetical protein